MRRSVREALVGFSLIAAAGSGFTFWLWLKGVSMSQSTWTLQASFADAAGLAERSPVVYRGVLVGNVRRLKVTDQAVVVDLEINDPKLLLPRPVVARVGAASLLGGDAQVALISAGQPLPASSPAPRDPSCNNRRMVCQNGMVQGLSSATLSSVTDTVQKMLDEADQQKLVNKLVAATVSFEATADETKKLTIDGQVFLKDAQVLVNQLNRSATKLDPILANINTASVDTATEKQIQLALDHLLAGRTSIVVAHRLSTVRKADAIAVVEAGRIIEMGKHDELVRKGGLYSRLWSIQSEHTELQTIEELFTAS